MEPSEILHTLTHGDGLPRAALRACSERRGEMLPLFIEEIERFQAAPTAEAATPSPLFFIFHLLGEWRETSAYRPLARLLRCPPADLDAIFGYGLVETSHRVMAAVFDGDPQPIFGIILDPQADEFVRSRMCEALAMVTLHGAADREVVARFLRDGFAHIRPQAECYVWYGWQSAIAMLGLQDLRSIVKTTFKRRFISPRWLRYEHFEEYLQRGIMHPGEPRFAASHEYTLFGDTIEELSEWYCFTEAYRLEQERLRQWAEDEVLPEMPIQPHVNPYRTVGRNDPCPCGSGKKFKKCCLI